MVLLGVILFSASMVFPAVYNSKYRDLMQGGAVGLMVAGSVIAIKTLIEERKSAR